MIRPRRRMPRMLLALLVMAIWLAAPVMPMPPASAAVATVLAEQTICHVDATHGATPDRHGPAHPADHGDCGMCPLCHVLGGPLLVPMAAAAPKPQGTPVRTGPTALPPATGPPPVLRAATSPRGPPARSV